MLKLLIVLPLPFLIAASPIDRSDAEQSCVTNVEDTKLAEAPQVHKLGNEPAAAMFATVDKRVDNCSVLVVMNAQLTDEPAWTPPKNAPKTEFQTVLGN